MTKVYLFFHIEARKKLIFSCFIIDNKAFFG